MLSWQTERETDREFKILKKWRPAFAGLFARMAERVHGYRYSGDKRCESTLLLHRLRHYDLLDASLLRQARRESPSCSTRLSPFQFPK